MKLEKGIDVLKSRSRGAESAFICSYLINPLALKRALGRTFAYDALLLYSSEKTVDLDRSIKTRKFLDASSIPLLGHAFHSKLYLFEHNTRNGSELDLIVASFNATSAGLNQNLEFWVEAKAQVDLAGFGAKNLVELVLDPRVDVDAISWSEFCLEETQQLVVTPALEVLWRLARNGVGLAPGKPKCIPDLTIAEGSYQNYNSILVHTLGNNSLSKAMEIMIREAAEKSDNVTIRVVSPYHNIQGLKYLCEKCINIVGDREISVNVEVLTVFPPDFPEKFGDPKKQVFARIRDIVALSSEHERVKFCLKLWKKEMQFSVRDIDQTTDESNVRNVFLHAKAILVRSKKRCQCLIGSPNITDAAIGNGPGLNFETAVWERRDVIATRLWKDLNSLFEISSEVVAEDYSVLKTWSDFFSSGQYKAKTIISGSRDAIGHHLKFLIKKDTEVFPLSIHEELPVYYDEIDHTRFLVASKAGAPKMNSKARVFFIPSKLEKTAETQREFANGELSTGLLLDRTKPDTISIRVDIESKLIEEYTVNVKEKGSRIEVISHNILIWDPVNEEATLMVETQNGPVEISCTIDESSMYAEKPSHTITNQKALLRIYSKSEVNCNSFGYFKIRYRKRKPRFEAKLACVTPFPFSVYFKELANPLSARILPHSISISLSTKDNGDIATIPIATRMLSSYPFIQSFLMCFAKCGRTDLREMQIEVRFEDEHDGYYDFVLPAQRVGYSQIGEKEIAIYLPEEMTKEIFLASSFAKEKLIPKPDKDGFSHFVIPAISFLCDRDDNRLWILEDFITKFRSILKSQNISCFPARGSIVDSAPISLELSSLDIPKRLRKICKSALLRWWVRRWSRGRGADKSHRFILPITFELLPSEIENGRQAFDTGKGPFEGYLDIELHYLMEGGYDILHRRETFKVIKTENFMGSIEKKILNYLKDKRQLISALVQLFHSVVAAEMPFDIFKNAIKGDESALLALREKYEYSPLVSDGFPLFDCRFEKYHQLIEETLKPMLESVFETFSADPKLPRIPKDVLVEFLREKVRKLIISVLIDQGLQNELKIAPAKLFEKIDPKWKLYF